MNERDLIAYLKKTLPVAPNIRNWMDEDCEIIKGRKEDLLVSIDTSSENVDFPTSAPPYEIGYFSVALGLSDIAACGGTPIGVLVSCSIPSYFKNQVDQIYQGAQGAVTDTGTYILGGDTNSAGELSLSVVSLGRVEAGRALRRSKAGVGDLIGVTGELDRFNYGYYQYFDHQEVDFHRMLRQPARLYAGMVLQKLGFVTSCIDLPDGLIKALQDTTPPNLGFEIEDQALPVEYFMSQVDRPYRYHLATHPAGDLELLFTIPRDKAFQTTQVFQSQSLSIHWIGRVIDQPGIRIVTRDGITEPERLGFVHKMDDYQLFT